MGLGVVEKRRAAEGGTRVRVRRGVESRKRIPGIVKGNGWRWRVVAARRARQEVFDWGVIEVSEG